MVERKRIKPTRCLDDAAFARECIPWIGRIVRVHLLTHEGDDYTQWQLYAVTPTALCLGQPGDRRSASMVSFALIDWVERPTLAMGEEP